VRSKSSPPPAPAGAFATGQYRNLFVEAGPVARGSHREARTRRFSNCSTAIPKLRRFIIRRARMRTERSPTFSMSQSRRAFRRHVVRNDDCRAVGPEGRVRCALELVAHLHVSHRHESSGARLFCLVHDDERRCQRRNARAGWGSLLCHGAAVCFGSLGGWRRHLPVSRRGGIAF
jgi:hypothetical protein